MIVGYEFVAALDKCSQESNTIRERFLNRLCGLFNYMYGYSWVLTHLSNAVGRTFRAHAGRTFL